jgi:hypothetical protein
MARPRVFISSTFYDLRQVRADLERTVRELGYDPVLNERGSIPYGSQERVEEYCYREIGTCDILIAIVGGRFGSESQHLPYSVSQVEIQTALKLGRQVYLFIENAVWNEYHIYLANKDVEGVRFRYADDKRVYHFIEEVAALPQNNPIATFTTSDDISMYLKEQWAGLFQRFLREQSRVGETKLLEELQTTAKTLNQLVTFLTKERRSQDEAIRSILLVNHPAFEELRRHTGTPYRIVFMNEDELKTWLEVRNFKPSNVFEWDDENVEEWVLQRGNKTATLKISRDIFDDDGKLRILTREEWDPTWIQLQEVQSRPTSSGPSPFDADDDDLPF